MSVNRYIPNVDDVRRRYMLGVWEETEDTSGDTNAEFFRFLDQRDAEVAKAERERIIKLLEAEIQRVSTPMLVEREYLDGLEEAISLIKGENK